MSKNKVCTDHPKWQTNHDQFVQRTKAKRHLRVDSYNASPKLCQACETPLTYDQRHYKCCSHSCSAQLSNRRRAYQAPQTKPRNPCVVCNTLTIYEKFCSLSCKRDHETTMFLEGKVICRKTLKHHMLKTQPSECEICKLAEWRGDTLPLELDHIDGDAGNNMPSNLRIICPNCHSITPTWKGYNKGKGRKARGLALT